MAIFIPLVFPELATWLFPLNHLPAPRSPYQGNILLSVGACVGFGVSLFPCPRVFDSESLLVGAVSTKYFKSAQICPVCEYILYICIYVFIYPIYIYIYLCSSGHWMFLYSSGSAHRWPFATCAHVCVSTCTSMCVHECLCICVYMSVCFVAFVLEYTRSYHGLSTYVNLYQFPGNKPLSVGVWMCLCLCCVCMCICMCICVCVFVCLCVWIEKCVSA